MSKPVMTGAMVREFDALMMEAREIRGEGLIGARAWALGVMLQQRRTDLLDYLHLAPLASSACCSAESDVMHNIARLNAEISLLLIERGA